MKEYKYDVIVKDELTGKESIYDSCKTYEQAEEYVIRLKLNGHKEVYVKNNGKED